MQAQGLEKHRRVRITSSVHPVCGIPHQLSSMCVEFCTFLFITSRMPILGFSSYSSTLVTFVYIVHHSCFVCISRWSLLHLAALSGSPDMMSVVYNITRITPSSQPLWSWDIRGPGGITPVHFAALHLANNQFLPSQMPEFQQGTLQHWHTICIKGLETKTQI